MNARSSLARILRVALICVSTFLFVLADKSSHAQEPPDGKMRITLSAPNTWMLSVATDSLWEYRIEASDDLQTWQPLDSIFLPGDGAVHSQRVVVPQGAIKAFFRYRVQERANGLSGNTLTDWDRIYSFNADTFLDTDHDGVPDYLETAFATNKYDSFSFPWQVVRVDPFDNEAGHPRDGAIVVYLNRPLPASVVTVPANFVRELHHDLWDVLDFANVAPGSTMILPGRKAVAFLPSPNLSAGSNHTFVNNYKIDFSTAVTGIPQLIPWHSEFSTVNTFDDVGPWVKVVRPGETAIEVATDFTPVIEWNQPLHPATVVSGNVSVYETDTAYVIPATVAFDYDTNRMTIQHATAFQPDTAYTVTLSTGFTNLMGKPLLNAFTWSFRTRPLRPQPVAGQGPFVTGIAPVDFSTNVDPFTVSAITLIFSEAMDAATLSAATVHLRAHRAVADETGTFAYDSNSKTLTFAPNTSLAFATHYELTLDAAAIFSAATTPQALQANAQFVFTTGQNPFQNGGGTGGMGGVGSGSGGSSGTPDPAQSPPLQLQLSYGDNDGDASGSVLLLATLPDGSQRQMQMPIANNEYRTELSPEFPNATTVDVTPLFYKGSDPDLEEEMHEVYVSVNAASGGLGYTVFKSYSGSPWNFIGQLVGGAFTAQVKNDADQSEKLKVAPPWLKIYNGQDAPNPVPEESKYSTGAFTVANLNDTDGNGTIDRQQQTVPGEKDLMQLKVTSPKGITAGRVKLTVTNGNVKFWETKEKGTEIPKDNTGAVFFNITSGSWEKILWVEARDASGYVRDIEILLGYEDANTPPNLADAIDAVKATAVWVTLIDSKNLNPQPLWPDCGEGAFTTFYSLIGMFGKNFDSPIHGISYGMGFEFQVLPAWIGSEPNVKFDVTRQKEMKTWIVFDGLASAFPPGTTPAFPSNPDNDIASDDATTGAGNYGDDSNVPTNDHIFSVDGPGLSSNTVTTVASGGQNYIVTDWILRKNFKEYVRVSFDGSQPAGNNNTGSRCSNKIPWHMLMWVWHTPLNLGNTYTERPDKANEVGGGNVPLGTAP